MMDDRTAFEDSIAFIFNMPGSSSKPKRISLNMIVKRNLPQEAASWSHEQMIEELNKITHLRLDRESIANIDDLELLGTAVTNVYLQHNLIKKIENLECLHNLRFLTLAANQICVVENLIRLPKLALLDLSENIIEDFDIEELPQTLSFLSFKGNPCTSLPDYRKRIIQDLPKLKMLDEEEVTKRERREVGYNVSSDSDSGQEEDQLEPNVVTAGDIEESIQDMAAKMLLRSQGRLEDLLEQHKSRVVMLDDLRAQSVVPPDTEPFSSRLSEEPDSRASSASSARLGSHGSPLPPIAKT